MSFQTTTLSISIVIFLFFLAIIGIMLVRNKNDFKYPPETGTCPDYWELLKTGECSNKQNLGKMDCDKIKNFNTDEFKGSKGPLKKCQWAQQCNLTWDGITNVSIEGC
jgi:hypothetical protein